MDENRLSQLALHFIPGIGNYAVKQLVSYAGSAKNVFNLPKSKLLRTPGIGNTSANAILNHRPLAQAEEELKRTDQAGIRLLLYTDPEFPQRLKHINDAPSLLYYKGTADLNKEKIVAIVGTRKASPYGKELTSELIKALIKHSPLIVSGLAYGIDIQAHKESLKNKLPTVGVMASGLNIVYPAVHREVARKMAQDGGLLSEHRLDTKPDAHNFPARNRIIAGMADAVVIVEAARKGGALITAEIANSYNKDVFAFPGNVHETYSEGCNNLIKMNKAHLLTGIRDLEYIMNWMEASKQVTIKPNLDKLDENEKLVFLELQTQNTAVLIDNLSWKTQIPVAQLASILLSLEFQGFVSSLPGKCYKTAGRA